LLSSENSAMTFALQTPPNASAEKSTSPAAQPVLKSIFVSKTVWGVVFTAVAAISPIVAEKVDTNSFKAKDAAQIVVILCGAASAVIGRVDAGSVYTPKCLPGPNKPH
jgi:hypothetical protein